MHAQCSQDPVTDELLGSSGIWECASSEPTAIAAVRGAPSDLAGTPARRRFASCGQEMRQEAEMRRKLEEELLAERLENAELRQQIRDQHQDLLQLGNMLGSLETQVEGHELVIKQQSLRIRSQEETIQQLSLRMQQYLALMLEHPHKTLF